MPLENEQELQQAMAELVQQLQGGQISLSDFEKSVKKTTTGLKGLEKTLKDPAYWEGIARGLGSFAGRLASGDSGLKTFNTVIDTAANAAGGLAKAIPFAGEAISAAFKATADASKFLVDQLDQTAKSFNEIGTAGALTARGMTGLRDQFARAGLSLQGFQKQVMENSETLAAFRGLTGDGAEDFSKIVGDLTQGTDMSLRRLGMNADQIAGTTAAFIKQQTQLGRAQIMSNEELRRGTTEYAKELDLISKITGQNREAIQKQQDAALSESRFRAVYEEMMANGQVQQAKALMNLQTTISGLDKETGQGLRDLSSGVADTAAAQKLLNSTNGAAIDIVERLKTGQISQAEAQIELKNAVNGNIDNMRNLARYSKDVGDTYIGLAGAYKIGRAQYDKNGDIIKEATTQQEAQTESGDALTESTIKAQKQLEKLGVETSRLATEAMPTMAIAVDKATEAMIKMFNWANDTLGKGKGSKGSSLGEAAANSGAMGMGSEEIMSAVGAAVPTATGGGPPAIAPEDYIKFTGGTGSKEHFDQLQPHVQQQFMQMARDYNNLTGKKLQINSAFRSPDEQAAVNSGTNPKAAPGMSLHNVGRAIDIQSDQRSYLSQSGLLAQYGFKPLDGDPPHISAAGGAIISGPVGGYKPNLTMHGTEAVVPLNSPAAQSALGNSDNSILVAQLDRLDEMVSVMKNQLSVSTKIMQYSS